ncbi:MAG: SIS domain-containing protein [Deltaproteobacteria bacterium]|jgi:D-sedoheptulose 7-phosphate isomerase|nr:SIS domain-containing protein [Deltaproteobacteria bacterium]
MDHIVAKAFEELTESLGLASKSSDLLIKSAKMISSCLTQGGVVYLCGNGGSAAEAQHFAAEFVGRFLVERPGLSAVALTTDTSKLTAIGNDYGYEEVFARQIKALGKPGDVLWALSTSGTSKNVIKAFEAARANGLSTIFMCGLKIHDPKVADLIIASPGANTPRVQELHLLFGHVICQLVDHILIEGGGAEG